MAASNRVTRAKKGLNYAKLNSVGTTGAMDDEQLEEGQLQDSPLRIEASDDEFGREHPFLEQSSAMVSRLRDDDDQSMLDYDDIDLGRLDDAAISVSSGSNIEVINKTGTW